MIFEQAAFGPITLRNRIIKAATFEGRTPHGLVTDELIDYHLAPARGGVAMTTVAYLAVAPEGRTHREVIVVGPDTAPGLQRLTDAVHETGAKVSGQLGHAGPVANGRSNGVHALASSRMPSPLSMQMIHAATELDLARITKQYAAAARTMVDVGFDALEIHLAHGYLISSFLAPGLNRRRDKWGGPLENRARLARQVVRAVRDEVGDEVAVYAKTSVSDGFKGGLTTEEALEFALLLEADGCLDALELSGGSSLMNPMYLFRGEAPRREFADAMAMPLRLLLKAGGARFLKAYPYAEAYFRDKALRFRAELKMPLIALGGYTERATLDQAMDDGFEFVAMARALLREPDLVDRYAREEARTGICIHCNRCMPTIYDQTRGTHCPLVEL
ncbi:MAG: NADH:flavin oxidoreductase [Nocardioides sp.]